MIYRAEIDGLRAFAVLAVIAFHAKLDSFSGGFVGVDVFFVISGYLISSLIFADCEKNRFSIVDFYERRARRIMPALIVVAAVSIVPAVILMFPYQLIDFSESIVATFTFTSNILFWWESGYFGEFESKKPLLHTWTLSVEEHFYIVFPLLCMFFWKRSKVVLVVLICCICIGSFLLSDWASTRYGGVNFYLTPTRIWELGIGVLVAVYLRKKLPVPSGIYSDVISAFGLLLMLSALLLFDENTPFPGRWALLPCVGTALVIVCANDKSLVGKVLSFRPFVVVGLVSYSAYLWHQPVFAFTTLGYPGLMTGWALLLPFSLVAVFSYLSWQYVEKPFRDRERYSQRLIFSMSGLSMVILITIGIIGILLNGVPQRFSENDRSIVTLNTNELGRYNSKVFNALKNKKFEADAGKKILIVGDSHARDLLNVFNNFESTIEFDISTLGIPRPCGVALEGAALVHVDEVNRIRCSKIDRFQSKELVSRVREADHVILVQSWLPWVVKGLPELLTHLKDIGANKVLVVGRKNFGKITPFKYLGLSLDEKLSMRLPLTQQQQDVDNLMLEILGDGNYFNFAREVCGASTSCPIFTQSGDLISYDGGHLTPDGAEYIASLLQRLPTFREILGE